MWGELGEMFVVAIILLRFLSNLKLTYGLTACTPGSAPGPTLDNEYERTLTLPFYLPESV